MNMLWGQYKKELIDNYVDGTYDSNTDKTTYTYGIDALKNLSQEEFKKAVTAINKEAKEKAYQEFYLKYYNSEDVLPVEEEATPNYKF